MRAIATRGPTVAASRRTMAHKIDLGFHHHNVLVTATPAAVDPCCTVTSSSGSMLPQNAHNMLTCTVRTPRRSEVVMRCMPADDDGPFDPTGNKVLDGVLLDLSGTDASDAIIGDDYTNIDQHGRLIPSSMFKSGTAAADAIVGDDYATLDQSGRPRARAGAPEVNYNMAKSIKAQIPKGPLAYNAAHCEKMPGDPPGDLHESDLAALRGAPQPMGQHTTEHSNQKDSGKSASSGRAKDSSSRVTPSAPANNPKEIKKIVNDETFGIIDN